LAWAGLTATVDQRLAVMVAATKKGRDRKAFIGLDRTTETDQADHNQGQSQ
jgi:hypothetical protein